MLCGIHNPTQSNWNLECLDLLFPDSVTATSRHRAVYAHNLGPDLTSLSFQHSSNTCLKSCVLQGRSQGSWFLYQQSLHLALVHPGPESDLIPVTLPIPTSHSPTGGQHTVDKQTKSWSQHSPDPTFRLFIFPTHAEGS